MGITAWVFVVQAGLSPTCARESILMRGDKQTAVHWVTKVHGCIIVRTREEVTGPRSGVGTGGGAVALMAEVMASGITLPESAPLSSYTCGRVV